MSKSSTKQLQAKAAAAKRWNHPDRDDLTRDYAAQRIADCVQKVLAAAPPLTDEQRTRIAALLRVGGEPTRKAVVADRLAELDGGAA